MFNFNDLKVYEAALFRVLTEFFFKYTKINALHKMALSDLENRVIEVSMKWEKTIKSMTTEQLQREDFKERIKKGALYFHSELTEIFSKTIPLTKEVETNNKVGAKRFDSTYTELKQTYDAKQDLLESMMEEDFTITNYLTRSKRLFSTVFPMEPREKEEREKKIKTNLKRKNQHF